MNLAQRGGKSRTFISVFRIWFISNIQVWEAAMKSLVIYETYFGNTEKIAQAVAKTLGAEAIEAVDAKAAQLSGVELLVAASPTRAFRPTEKITKFLKDLPDGALKGVKVTAFDTRMDVQKVNNKLLTFMARHMGYADAVLAKMMVKKGGQLLEPTAGFFVDESEGPLAEGELERAVEWAKSISAK
jgi:flavodoxin I